MKRSKLKKKHFFCCNLQISVKSNHMLSVGVVMPHNSAQHTNSDYSCWVSWILNGHPDSHHNDTQHNDTKHNGLLA